MECNVCHKDTLSITDSRREVTHSSPKEDWVRYHTNYYCSTRKARFVDHSHPHPEKKGVTMDIKKARQIVNDRIPIDFRYKDNDERKWMVASSLSDDEITIYFRINGTGLLCSSSISDIILL